MLHKTGATFNRVMAFATAFTILMFGHPALAQSVGWFNGKLNESNPYGGVSSAAVVGGDWQAVFDDFDVPAGGWHIVGVFSNNLKLTTFTGEVTTAHWEIRTGITADNVGTVVASGTDSASWTPTGRHWGDPDFSNRYWDEYTVEVSGLNVTLAEGKYCLAVAPMVPGWNPPTALSITSGSDAVGDPPGDNGNSFHLTATSTYPEDLSARFKALTDFSLGLYVSTPPTPDFSITATPPARTIKAGKTATYLLTVIPQNGYSGTVDFTCNALPDASSCSILANGDGTATAIVDTTPGKKGTPKGSYNIVFRGTDSTLTRDTTVSLTVR